MTKEAKRQAIAQSAYPMLIKSGIDAFSLNTLLVEVEMSKGNFYHYFKNKDDLLFEVFVYKCNEIFEQYHQDKKKASNFEELLFSFFAMYISKDQATQDFLKFTNDLYVLNSNHGYKKLADYIEAIYQETFDELGKVIQAEVDSGVLNPVALTLVKPICATADGMLLHSFMLEGYDLSTELSTYLTSIASLLKESK